MQGFQLPKARFLSCLQDLRRAERQPGSRDVMDRSRYCRDKVQDTRYRRQGKVDEVQ